MGLTYDLLEDRHTIDVIVTKFFPLCFKMAESFENLDNISHDWAKDKGQKSLDKASNRFESRKRTNKPFLLKNNPEKFSSSLGRQSSETKSRTKLFLVSENNCYILNLTNPIIKMFLRLIYLKIKLLPVSK